jgi:hypothetical protein
MFRSKFFVDLAERVVATYLEAFLGLVIASAITDGVIDLSVVQSAAVAALPAGLAVVKGALARWRGDPDSASAAPSVTA